MTDIELANLIFPDVTTTIEDLEKRYPLRNLQKELKLQDSHLPQQASYIQEVYLLQ